MNSYKNHSEEIFDCTELNTTLFDQVERNSKPNSDKGINMENYMIQTDLNTI